jgi:hypothetical protein
VGSLIVDNADADVVAHFGGARTHAVVGADAAVKQKTAAVDEMSDTAVADVPKHTTDALKMSN